MTNKITVILFHVSCGNRYLTFLNNKWSLKNLSPILIRSNKTPNIVFLEYYT